MAETMEQCMSKTRADYGSGVDRPKIEDKDNFELKGQFLKELRTNTFSGSDHEDENEHIEKFLEIVDLFHIPNITIDQVMLRAFPIIRAQLNNLGREIKKVNEKVYAAQVGCEQCKGLHYTKDCPLKEEGASVSVMPLSTYLNLGLGELAHTKLTVELADRTVKYPKGIVESVIVGIGKFVFPVDFIILDMPEDVKVPLILGRQFLSTAHAKIDVFKRKITLRVGDEKIIYKSVKRSSSLINRIYMLSLRERLELDLEARLMRETLLLNRSLDPLYGDYIELNNLNIPLELRRDQDDDLMPTIKEGEVIEEFRARNDARMVSKIFVYPSDYDHDKKIRISCPYNLKFSCMIVLEDVDAYRDEGMGDVIFSEPLLREVKINARRFKEVTYQMVRSHPRFLNTTYSSLWIRRIGPRCKEIDDVGEVSTIWKSRSVGVLKSQDGCST
ncbi:gag-pol polyprotein, partial [Tanacetum coccineum]